MLGRLVLKCPNPVTVSLACTGRDEGGDGDGEKEMLELLDKICLVLVEIENSNQENEG